MALKCSLVVLVWVGWLLEAPLVQADCAERFCVGVIIPLSRYGEYGTAVRNGIMIAQESRPQLAKSIEFRFEDSAFNTKATLAGFKRLAELDHVRVIYVLGGPMSEAVAPLADRYQLPTLNSSNEPSTAMTHPFVIRFANPGLDLARRLALEVQKRGFKRIAVLITENPYMNSLLEGLVGLADKSVTVKVVHRGSGETMDFKSEIARIKSGGFDSVGVLLHPGQIRQFFRQLHDQRVSIVAFGTDALESETEVTAAGSAVEGTFFINHGVSEAFREAYRRRFGTDDLIAFAGWGHDLVVVLGELFNTSSATLSSQEVRKALEQERTYSGVTGQVRFIRTAAGDRYFQFPLKVRVVRGGKVVSAGE